RSSPPALYLLVACFPICKAFVNYVLLIAYSGFAFRAVHRRSSVVRRPSRHHRLQINGLQRRGIVGLASIGSLEGKLGKVGGASQAGRRRRYRGFAAQHLVERSSGVRADLATI